MSEIPIGADIVEAATDAALDLWPTEIVERSDANEAMEGAIRAALDKLGLREEREERGEAVIDSNGALNWTKARLISDWRQVDAEPVGQTDGGDRHLMEIVFGPCTRDQADDRAVDVQGLLDQHLPDMSAAVGIRYGLDQVDTEPSEPDRIANDLCGDIVAERDRLRSALERADTLLMAANGALGRAIANRANPDRTLDDALQDVKARLAAVSDTTLTALHEEPSATSEGELRG